MKRYLVAGASRGIGRRHREKLAAPDVGRFCMDATPLPWPMCVRRSGRAAAGVVELIHDSRSRPRFGLVAAVERIRSICW